jgi:hypothetical protein
VSWDLASRVLATLIIVGWVVAGHVYGSDARPVWVLAAIVLAFALYPIAFKLVRRALR